MSHGPAPTGEIKRTAGGWAIRYRDGRGVRRQRGGFKTKAEAKHVLDDELRKARLGPLYRPDVTLRELVEVFMEQYQGAPASHGWMRQHLGKATTALGDVPIGELDALVVARWRVGLPVTMRHGAHRALRQVLAAAMRWQWIDRNVATDVPNSMHARMEFDPFESWEEVDALARELGPFGPLAIFCVGTGVRPEEAFGADWSDVDLVAGVFTVRRAFAKGRLKSYPKTDRSRRRIPLRARVDVALRSLPRHSGVLFSSAGGGGRIDINNFRSREWAPALKAAGLPHRRIYDMRHTFATWSLAAGMSIFTLARRMGTSLQMIDRTYGHLAQDAEDQDRDPLSYDYAGAVLWNWHAPGLWNRFTVELVRALATKAGLSEAAVRELVRIAYAKVAEFQARGLVHFHAIIRLDNPADRALAPNLEISANELCEAIKEAADRSSLQGHAGGGEVVELRFGEQVHTRVLHSEENVRDPDRERVAAYVAKYSCKGSHHTITRADSRPEQLRENGVPEQLVQMAAAALQLAERPGLQRVGEWVHMLGFRGHFVTKSRGFSTTLGALRGVRAKWRAERDEQLDDDDDSSTPVLASWQYIGSGYLNPGDVLLAAGVEASIRTAREALLDVRRRPPDDL